MENEANQENFPPPSPPPAVFPGSNIATPIDLCDSDDDDFSGLEDLGNVGEKRGREWPLEEKTNVKRLTGDELALVLLPQGSEFPPPPSPPSSSSGMSYGGCKQFWKAGDYEGTPGGGGDRDMSTGGYDHVRVHPKFLHSNATSHKWALGAFAELLDNALDEVASGATYVNVDVLENKKAGNRMLLIQDNGGGMNPEMMRHCMSLGYSAKSKRPNTIGQYGNGFKTSTMRLGADVIVFSRSLGNDKKSPTQSIGLLSYTFLRSTKREEIVVPMLDYQRKGTEWRNIAWTTPSDLNKNMETIFQWSPFSSEEDLLRQFDLMGDHGTRVIIFNLWEDDQHMLELDFDTHPHDIQLRGANRDEKKIEMASKYPNSRHFLTYRHSLRSYVAILYLRVPTHFRIILRGIDVEHHSVVNDMMQSQQNLYRPHIGADSTVSTIVTLGFVKDAMHHIDVQGFNVYHKNRLIKPFWRVWNVAGSDGRGVIGVVEANFVEPAHDKQGFECTATLSRLESKLTHLQKEYWNNYCHKIGYAQRRDKTNAENAGEGSNPTCISIPVSATVGSNSIPNHGGDNGNPAGKDGPLSLLEELRREKERNKILEAEVKSTKDEIEDLKKQHDVLIEAFSTERDRRDGEEEVIRKKLEEAKNTIAELSDKIKLLELSNESIWRNIWSP